MQGNLYFNQVASCSYDLNTGYNSLVDMEVYNRGISDMGDSLSNAINCYVKRR